MVCRVAEDVSDERVLRALSEIPRDEFVPDHLRDSAYEDTALAIGERQTISQPLIVGLMTEALSLTGNEHVLEIGTGSGYQAAVLSRLAATVVTIERIKVLRLRAIETLERLRVSNVVSLPNGELIGAPEHGPYDAIMVTAAAPRVPDTLLDQLRPGGRLVIPVGDLHTQDLIVVTSVPNGTKYRKITACRFVPLVGPEGFPETVPQT